MRVKDYEKVTSLEANDVLLIDGERGVKSIAPGDIHKQLLDETENTEWWAMVNEFCSKSIKNNTKGPGINRRKFFRGYNLGEFSEVKKKAIQNSTFDNMFIGDYFYINGHIWRIWDFNYWLKKGDISCETPHILVGPDNNLYSYVMNDTNTTEGGFERSKMFGSGLNEAYTMLSTDFGGANLLIHRELVTNAVSNGMSSAGEWIDSNVILMNEFMVYGHSVFAPANNGTTTPYNYTIDINQLAIFQLWPEYQNIQRSWYWLRDVAAATDFASSGSYGIAHCYGAVNQGGVRPVCGIIG